MLNPHSYGMGEISFYAKILLPLPQYHGLTKRLVILILSDMMPSITCKVTEQNDEYNEFLLEKTMNVKPKTKLIISLVCLTILLILSFVMLITLYMNAGKGYRIYIICLFFSMLAFSVVLLYTFPVCSRFYQMKGIMTENEVERHTLEKSNKLREQAEESNRIKTAFIQNMSHEIRTPLNAIVGFVELLDSDVPQDEKHNFLNIIRKNSDMLARIVDDILLLSIIENGELTFNRKQIELSSFICGVAESVRPRLHEGVRLVCNNHGEMNVCIDAVKLKWVLVTLLMNADKFTPHGTITLNYMFRRGNLFVCVKDTGIGIAPENRERIFRHFEKVDTFTQGIGVGLSICKAIVEKADGRIGVRSELGKGSTFWLMIPTKSKDE